MSVPTATVDGLALARFHLDGDAPDDGVRLAHYAESARRGDWSLRSAVVRYAQPEPARASAILELVRRTDGALKPLAKALERAEGPSDPALAAERFAGGTYSPSERRRIDARAADLARVALGSPDELDRVLGEYESVVPLDDDERDAVPLLGVALVLDRLGDVLAAWADDRTRARPDDQVDSLARQAFTMLGTLGVARERRQPRRSER